MKSKTCASIILATITIILALNFALFPFLEHKINWDYVAEKVALKSADAGLIDIAEKISSKIKFKPFLNKTNAHIALYKLQNESEETTNAFIKTCGKNFDFEEYEARKLIREIANEPAFAAGLLKMKYQREINSFKNPFLKALLYYNMSLKAKPKDAPTYAQNALSILKSQPKSEELSLTCTEISTLALKNNRYETIPEILKCFPQDTYYLVSMFRLLRDKNFYNYIKETKNYSWLKRAIIFHQNIKNKKNLLNAGETLTYTALKSNYNWITNNYRDFNIPLLAYISYILDEKDAFNFYKQYALSAENIDKIKGSQSGYFNAVAIYFSAINDFKTAYDVLNTTKYFQQKLYILNSIALQLPSEKKSIEDFINELEKLN